MDFPPFSWESTLGKRIPKSLYKELFQEKPGQRNAYKQRSRDVKMYVKNRLGVGGKKGRQARKWEGSQYEISLTFSPITSTCGLSAVKDLRHIGSGRRGRLHLQWFTCVLMMWMIVDKGCFCKGWIQSKQMESCFITTHVVCVVWQLAWEAELAYQVLISLYALRSSSAPSCKAAKLLLSHICSLSPCFASQHSSFFMLVTGHLKSIGDSATI